MHSLSLAQDILQAALLEAEKHEGKPITAISVKVVGEHLEEADSLRFCLEAMVKGTLAEGARIEVEGVGAADCCCSQEPLEVTLELGDRGGE